LGGRPAGGGVGRGWAGWLLWCRRAWPLSPLRKSAERLADHLSSHALHICT